MLQNRFSQRKRDILSKQDKSSKGNWDEKIKSLCEKINSLENYYTTSSCSGRILLMVDQVKKGPNLFLYVYHDKLSFKKLKNDLNKVSTKKMLKFKQEPPIIHVACKNVKDAFILLNKARKAGWKRSGIISRGKGYFVELISTEKFEFLIMNQRKILLDNPYLELIVKRVNENLENGWKKIKKLEKLIQKTSFLSHNRENLRFSGHKNL